MTVFIARIVVPSLFRSGVAPKEALAAGSLHTINTAGVTFLFRYKNIVVAILGVLVGAAAALVIKWSNQEFGFAISTAYCTVVLEVLV